MNYPTEPNYVEQTYYKVSRRDFSVSPEDNDLQGKWDKGALSALARSMVCSVNGIVGRQIANDLILLDNSRISSDRYTLRLGLNKNGETIWEEESTSVCSKVAYIN